MVRPLLSPERVMFTVLLVLLIVVSFLLIGFVLIQSGKGTGLAASFGGAASSTDAFMGTRQVATFFSKGSWWLGGVFLLLAYMLAIMSARPSMPKSALDQPVTQQPVAPAQQPPAGASPLLPLQAAPQPAPVNAPANAPAKKAPPR